MQTVYLDATSVIRSMDEPVVVHVYPNVGYASPSRAEEYKVAAAEIISRNGLAY